VIPEVAKALEVSENTFHRWRNQYGGMKANDAKPGSCRKRRAPG
jgi:transposase-like protein